MSGENITEEALMLFVTPSSDIDKDPNTVALDAFGNLLMRLVRDAAIVDMDNIVNGRTGGIAGEQFPDIKTVFNEDQRAVLLRLVESAVDTTIHHLLWTLDRVKWLDVSAHTEAGTVPSLKHISDGLHGETYDWIPRFSKQRHELES